MMRDAQERLPHIERCPKWNLVDIIDNKVWSEAAT
jgi:hypothetical protein